MEGERKKHEESEEEMYFEMDFTPSKDDLNCDDEFNDSSSLSDILNDKPVTPNLDLAASLDQIIRSSSTSIPIQSCNRTLRPTSELNTPSNWGSPSNQSEQRTQSPPCLKSRSIAGTPTSSVSPSSSFIPRILRESFSKLLSRSSFSRAKTPDREQACSDSECYNCDERRASECSTVSPATEEVVNESLRNGLPIIPFAYPTFFMASKKQEDEKRRIRKNSIKSMKRSFSEGRCLDYSEAFKEDEKTLNKKFSSEDKSLDSIVRMAKQEMENSKQDKTHQPASRKESQSSYVEMNPGEVLSTERTMTSNEDPYMRMEDFLENRHLHMERKRESDNQIFNLEDSHETKLDNPFPIPYETLGRKPIKRKNNFLQAGKERELLMQESMGRQFKKGNKNKDDYVFFDFEQNNDYVDMDKAKTKKWKFIDFKKN